MQYPAMILPSLTINYLPIHHLSPCIYDSSRPSSNLPLLSDSHQSTVYHPPISYQLTIIIIAHHHPSIPIDLPSISHPLPIHYPSIHHPSLQPRPGHCCPMDPCVVWGGTVTVRVVDGDPWLVHGWFCWWWSIATWNSGRQWLVDDDWG